MYMYMYMYMYVCTCTLYVAPFIVVGVWSSNINGSVCCYGGSLLMSHCGVLHGLKGFNWFTIITKSHSVPLLCSLLITTFGLQLTLVGIVACAHALMDNQWFSVCTWGYSVRMFMYMYIAYYCTCTMYTVHVHVHVHFALHVHCAFKSKIHVHAHVHCLYMYIHEKIMVWPDKPVIPGHIPGLCIHVHVHVYTCIYNVKNARPIMHSWQCI